MRKSLRIRLLEFFEFRFYFDYLRLGVNVALNEETVAQMVLYVNENQMVIVRMADSKALPLTTGGDPLHFGPKKANAMCTLRSEDAAVCPASR